MAIALKRTEKPVPEAAPAWRGIAAVLALGAILVGIALSGGLQPPDRVPVTRVPDAVGAAPQGPVFDNRGKWTGY